MCYDKANNKMFAENTTTMIDPLEYSSDVIFQLNVAKDLLLRIKELPMFQSIFNEGEQTSIKELIKKTEGRVKITESFQKSFINS